MRGALLNTRAQLLALAASLAAGCGYEATPLEVDLHRVLAADGSSERARQSGFLDPDASDFAAGALVYVRFPVEREGAVTGELLLDLNLEGVPPELRAFEAPVRREGGGQVDALLQLRDVLGEVVGAHRPTQATVRLLAWRRRNLRHASAGDFDLAFEDDAVFARLSGVWESQPHPEDESFLEGDTEVGAGDTAPPGDSAPPGDAANGDEAGGDTTEGDTAGFYDGSTGCECGTPAATPDPDGGDPNDGDANSGADDDGDASGDADGSGSGSESSGCAGDEDYASTDGCGGDELSRSGARARAMTSSTRPGVCAPRAERRGWGRLGAELLPVLGAFMVARRRRRPSASKPRSD